MGREHEVVKSRFNRFDLDVYDAIGWRGWEYFIDRMFCTLWIERDYCLITLVSISFDLDRGSENTAPNLYSLKAGRRT